MKGHQACPGSRGTRVFISGPCWRNVAARNGTRTSAYQRRFGPVHRVQVMRGGNQMKTGWTFPLKRSHGHKSDCKQRCRLKKEKKNSKTYKTKSMYLLFHIKSGEKYTKIENNYSRRHGRYVGSGWEGLFVFHFLQYFVSASLFGGGTV